MINKSDKRQLLFLLVTSQSTKNDLMYTYLDRNREHWIQSSQIAERGMRSYVGEHFVQSRKAAKRVQSTYRRTGRASLMRD